MDGRTEVRPIVQIAGNNAVQLLDLRDLSIRKAVSIGESVGSGTLVSKTKLARTKEEVTMAFACFSTVSREASGSVLNIVGNARVRLGHPVPAIPCRISSPPGLGLFTCTDVSAISMPS
ncbi:uncharacterized protein MAM_05458 [Metarhizium album ARSEF 1941]|uniref:Uncharacterized protein n=1 Tax=Metarhizium album (strain ARSEF 1941) TaxID=1081103 RepID=A0A0B2WUB9_METAS|nr:uncharacterized protein MAM_05458 [Metarhizium album ARSEF 1941]KHN96515.1 hypothetical protein MAM_05458 [Metarhizium album ARSEF 1941]